MIYVEIYEVMWHAFVGILAALTLAAILCLIVLIACEFFRGRPRIMRGITALVAFPFAYRKLSARVQGIIENLRV